MYNTDTRCNREIQSKERCLPLGINRFHSGHRTSSSHQGQPGFKSGMVLGAYSNYLLNTRANSEGCFDPS